MQVWLSRVFLVDVSRDDRMAVTKEQQARERGGRERDNVVIGLFLSFGMTESKR